MTTYARVPLEQVFDTLLAELDDLIGRVLRQEPHLYLEANEGEWQVVDIANQNGVMLHSPDIMVCVRFMEAFAVKHPEATVERWSIAEAVREANVEVRMLSERAESVALRSAAGAVRSESSQHSVKVPPLRLVEAVE